MMIYIGMPLIALTVPFSMWHGLTFIVLKSTREDAINKLTLALTTDRCWGPRRQLRVHIFH